MKEEGILNAETRRNAKDRREGEEKLHHEGHEEHEEEEGGGGGNTDRRDAEECRGTQRRPLLVYDKYTYIVERIASLAAYFNI